mgnify:CR=1 FL=1
MKFSIPIKLPSLANMSHQHWRRLTELKKAQKQATSLCLTDAVNRGQVIPPPPLTIILTRIGPRGLDKQDNLNAAFKYVRDTIAATVGIDDGSDQYEWVYEQRSGGCGVYGVEVEITSALARSAAI